MAQADFAPGCRRGRITLSRAHATASGSRRLRLGVGCSGIGSVFNVSPQPRRETAILSKRRRDLISHFRLADDRNRGKSVADRPASPEVWSPSALAGCVALSGPATASGTLPLRRYPREQSSLNGARRVSPLRVSAGRPLMNFAGRVVTEKYSPAPARPLLGVARDERRCRT